MDELDRLVHGPPTDEDPGPAVVVEATAPDPEALLRRVRGALRWALGDAPVGATPADLLPSWATETTPSDPSWAPWLAPDERPWRFWEGSVVGPTTVRVVVTVEAWPTTLETLAALLQAAGASEVVVRY